MDRQYLRSAEFNKDNILNSVLAPNGFDGERAHKDVKALVHEEKIRMFSRKLTWFGLGGTVFSLYNVTRIGQLSPTGKPAAIAGVFFFAFLSYSSAARAGFLGHSAPVAATEVKKE